MIELYFWLLVLLCAGIVLGVLLTQLLCHLAMWKEEDERQLMEWMEEKNG